MPYLERRWAKFFDLANWKWEFVDGTYFLVTFPCPHSECRNGHTLRVYVKETSQVSDYDVFDDVFKHGDAYVPPNPAIFGKTPEATVWHMVCGHGGGVYSVPYWVPRHREFWHDAR